MVRIAETIVEAIAFRGNDYDQALLIIVPQHRHSPPIPLLSQGALRLPPKP